MSSYKDHLFHQSADGVLILDNNGCVLYANPAAASIFGRAEKDIIGGYFGTPIALGDSIQIEIPRERYRPHTIEIRTVPIKWDDQQAILLNMQDITFRKHIESTLQSAISMNNAVLNSLFASIAVLDKEGLIIRVNRSWENFATENGDINGLYTGIGKNYFEVCERSTDPQALDALDGMKKVLNGTLKQFDLEYPCDSPSTKRWFIMRVQPLVNQEIIGLVISHIDITRYRSTMQAQNASVQEEKYLAQQEIEFEAVALLDYPSNPAAKSPEPFSAEDTEQYILKYAEILDLAVEQRAYRVDNHISRHAEQLAEALTAHRAHPRDLVNIHMATLRRKRKQEGITARVQIYMDEGRLLLLEVMGYLAAAYRKTITGPGYNNHAE